MVAAPKPPADGVKVIRVEATRRGFYGNSMREPGTVFNLKIRDGEKFPSWCKLFDEGDSPAAEQEAEAQEDVKKQAGSSSDDVI